MGVLLVAVIAVRTNDGEELCSWYVKGDPDDYSVDYADIPVIQQVIREALRKEQRHGG